MTLVNDKQPGEIITEVYIDLDLLSVSSSKIRIFALDSQTIGISNNPPNLWIDNCLWQGETDITKGNDEYTIFLQQNILNFYQPRSIELASSTERDNVLLIIHH